MRSCTGLMSESDKESAKRADHVRVGRISISTGQASKSSHDTRGYQFEFCSTVVTSIGSTVVTLAHSWLRSIEFYAVATGAKEWPIIVWAESREQIPHWNTTRTYD